VEIHRAVSARTYRETGLMAADSSLGLQERDPRRIGPYRLVGRLGAGGMGRVYLGRPPAGRPVAIKVILEELAADPEFLVRFTREVAAAKSASGRLFTPPGASLS
jgi:serine/threonine protein kinase